MTALVTFPGGADVLEGAALPFAPGASPHTASAKLYRGVFRAIDKRWRGGRSAFLDAQIPSLRAFYDREWKDSDRVDAWPFFFAITASTSSTSRQNSACGMAPKEMLLGFQMISRPRYSIGRA